MSSFIELVDVKKSYGTGTAAVRAVDGISFTANRGEWIAIMGPSGSGKTTLLNLLGCLDQATSGALLIDGTDTSRLRRNELVKFRSETVGFVFQQFHLVPHLTALENVMLAQFFHSMTDESEALRALKQVGMEDRASHLPSQLSGGEQQRVAIARAIAGQPDILILDEPTASLDGDTGHAIVEFVKENILTDKRCILIVTHDARISDLATRIMKMEDGRLTGWEKGGDQ